MVDRIDVLTDFNIEINGKLFEGLRITTIDEVISTISYWVNEEDIRTVFNGSLYDNTDFLKNHSIKIKFGKGGISTMNFGEMFAWTNRLNSILDVSGPLKETRLESMVKDLEVATDLDRNYFARRLYLRVQEELQGYGTFV